MERGQHITAVCAGQRYDALEASFTHARAFTRHYHDTYSIGLVSKGRNVFRLEGKRIEVEAGAISVVNPEEIHDGGQAGEPWSYRCFFPTPALMTQLAGEMHSQTSAPLFASGLINDNECAQRLRRLFDLLFAPFSDAAALEEAALDALGTLLLNHEARGAPKRAYSPRYASIGNAAVSLIEKHWEDGPDLAQLSQWLGVDRFVVIRAVTAVSGLTPHAYLLQVRVKRALEMIRSGASISLAAQRAGFCDQAHLTREMKKRWGLTPAAFKSSAPPRF